MHPVVRALGKVLRLVGISSPEDALATREPVAGVPSWRTAANAKAPVGVPTLLTSEPKDGKQAPD